MRLLDLFCGAGGAAMGYHRAGFDEIVGVDLRPQPRYPFEFVQADAFAFLRDLERDRHEGCPPLFDAIHASPPCQAFTALRTAWNARPHDDLLTPTLAGLRAIGIPWVVENVPGSPLFRDLVLCGTMFDLGLKNAELRRHRWFNTSWRTPLLVPRCQHGRKPITIGVYGQHGQDRRRATQTFFSVEDGKKAMGIDWMTGDELSQAIPPAYTEYIGRQLIAALQATP